MINWETRRASLPLPVNPSYSATTLIGTLLDPIRRRASIGYSDLLGRTKILYCLSTMWNSSIGPNSWDAAPRKTCASMRRKTIAGLLLFRLSILQQSGRNFASPGRFFTQFASLEFAKVGVVPKRVRNLLRQGALTIGMANLLAARPRFRDRHGHIPRLMNPCCTQAARKCQRTGTTATVRAALHVVKQY